MIPVDRQVLIRDAEVKSLTKEGMTDSGIYLAGGKEEEEREQFGTEEGFVVAIGENAFEELSEPPKIGDRVLFPRYAGLRRKIEEDDKTEFFRVMRDDQIELILEEGD